MSDQDYIGVDLDGTLAEYHGWPTDGSIGKPIPAMLQRVKDWLDKGYRVRIVTARVMAMPESRWEIPGWNYSQRHAVESWCLKHIGLVLPIQFWKDPHMLALWDDRAVSVEKNMGRPEVSERFISQLQ